MRHPYIAFRIRLARVALSQFAASLKGSAEITAVVFGPVLLGLLALFTLPPMLAVTLPWPQGSALLLVHALAMALPAWLLRKRLVPRDVMQWLPALPIAPRLRLAAEAAVAALLLAPLALADAVSLGVWLGIAPPWIRPLPGAAACLVSLALTWLCAAAVLLARTRAPRPHARWRRAAPASGPYRQRRLRPRLLMLWHRLFWLPFWRSENVVGWQQSLLLVLASAGALAWMAGPALLPRALLGGAASALLTVLTDRGDKAVREQIAVLRPAMAAWPLSARRLELCASLFTLVPATLVLALLVAAGAAHGAWTHTAGRLYLLLALASQAGIVGLRTLDPRGRVGFLTLAILVQTAVGSEIWN